jgi:GNAT superfamily N-acetyltransferase
MSGGWKVESLTRQHDRHSFDCGVEELNEFLKKHARQNADKDVSRTYAAVAASPSRVVGFYTICAGSVDFEQLPLVAARGLPPYSVPTAVLARLAVDKSEQGKGLGASLIYDAIQRIQRVADEIGICAVTVNASDLDVRDFYLKFEFRPLLDDDLHLFLLMATIRKIGRKVASPDA